MRKYVILSFVISHLFSGPVFSDALSGTKVVSLVAGDGTKVAIGSVEFQPSGDVTSYRLTFDQAPFAHHFLSMRPFKCVEGPQKYWCLVPYPYEIRREVTEGDLTDLEYDLLFIWKGAAEYGINMWNGVYYDLVIEGDRITGSLRELDMDTLSAPPAPGNFRPLSADILHEADPDSHWLPGVVIE
ncbi:hypothetical protein GCM10011517_22860 [Actibacterium pelagium]|uniref:Uncharacterized protein n=1 Tax=Actibacterium pelagium TaxID=2029103 RepID=A0A917EKF8_9RHOB|nr:hypothetical protein GCM10011517_22860 [Actibacterium pelagium]